MVATHWLTFRCCFYRNKYFSFVQPKFMQMVRVDVKQLLLLISVEFYVNDVS